MGSRPACDVMIDVELFFMRFPRRTYFASIGQGSKPEAET
jgi:hypothetical protein